MVQGETSMVIRVSIDQLCSTLIGLQLKDNGNTKEKTILEQVALNLMNRIAHPEHYTTVDRWYAFCYLSKLANEILRMLSFEIAKNGKKQ